MLKKDRGKQDCEVMQLKLRSHIVIAEVAVAVVEAGSEYEGGLCCNVAMANLISEGHTVLFTYGGACTSNVRHISMICCGGRRLREAHDIFARVLDLEYERKTVSQ